MRIFTLLIFALVVLIMLIIGFMFVFIFVLVLVLMFVILDLLLIGILRHLVASTHLSLLSLSVGLSLHLGDFLLPLWQVIEPGVLKSIGGRYAHLRAELEHAVEQIQANLVDLG